MPENLGKNPIISYLLIAVVNRYSLLKMAVRKVVQFNGKSLTLTLTLIGLGLLGTNILIFCTFGLKMPTHAPKMWIFVAIDPQNGVRYKCNPQKVHRCIETCHMTYSSSKLVYWCRLCAIQRIN